MPAVSRPTESIPGDPHGGDQPRRSLHPSANCSKSSEINIFRHPLPGACKPIRIELASEALIKHWHLYHPPAPRFGEFDPCIWDHRCRTDRGSLRRHSKSRARLPRNTRPHSRTRHAFAVRHRHARDDRLGMVARVRLWLDAQAVRSFPPRFRPSPPHGCYSPRQPRGTLARTVPQPAVPAWAKVAVVFWVAFVPLAENVTLAGPVLDQV